MPFIKTKYVAHAATNSYKNIKTTSAKKNHFLN